MKAINPSFPELSSDICYTNYFLRYEPKCTVSFNHICTCLKNVENIRIFNWELCLCLLTYRNVIYIKLKLLTVAFHICLQIVHKFSRLGSTFVFVQVMLKKRVSRALSLLKTYFFWCIISQKPWLNIITYQWKNLKIPNYQKHSM